VNPANQGMTPAHVEKAREMRREPDSIVVPLVAGILSRALTHTAGCTIDDVGEREAALEAARYVATFAEAPRLIDTSPVAHGFVLAFVEAYVQHLDPWIGGGMSYYALRFDREQPTGTADVVHRFENWYRTNEPSLLEAVLLCLDCAGRVGRTEGAAAHLLAPAAKRLRGALIRPYQARLKNSWARALHWAYGEWTIESLSYFALNLVSTSTALSFKMNDVAALFHRAIDERDEAVAAQRTLEDEEVVRRSAEMSAERIEAAEARANAAEVAAIAARAELQAMRNERDRLTDRLSGALSRIESLQALLTHAPEAPDPGAPPSNDLPLALGQQIAAPPNLNGRRILVFTNQQRAGVRQEIRAGFERLGASSVEVIDVGRSFGPYEFPAAEVVVIDITFMAHSAADVVREKARKAGCAVALLRGGSSTLAERTAVWLARRVERGRDE